MKADSWQPGGWRKDHQPTDTVSMHAGAKCEHSTQNRSVGRPTNQPTKASGWHESPQQLWLRSRFSLSHFTHTYINRMGWNGRGGQVFVHHHSTGIRQLTCAGSYRGWVYALPARLALLSHAKHNKRTRNLTFMHIMAKMRRLFCPSDNMPILQVCSRPVMPYLMQQGAPHTNHSMFGAVMMWSAGCSQQHLTSHHTCSSYVGCHEDTERPVHCNTSTSTT